MRTHARPRASARHAARGACGASATSCPLRTWLRPPAGAPSGDPVCFTRWSRYCALRNAIDQNEGGLEKFSKGAPPP